MGTEKVQTCPARNIQKFCPGRRAQPLHENVFPQAVNPQTHEIIHEVVGRGDGLEHIVNCSKRAQLIVRIFTISHEMSV